MLDAKVTIRKSYSKEEVNEMINNGVIREDYLMLNPNFDNIYELLDERVIESTSSKSNKEYDAEVWSIGNAQGTKTVWMSTMLNAKVIEGESPTVERVPQAGDMPVYFHDTFEDTHPNLKRLGDYRNEDGGFDVMTHYKIIGAVIRRSEVDETRWALGLRHFKHGKKWLELANLSKTKPARWLRESEMEELTKLPKEARTFKTANGSFTLPGELEVIAKADTDIRMANVSYFLLEKIWE